MFLSFPRAKNKKKGVDETPVSISLPEDARVSGFAGWFTADFHGTDENPCPCPVTLSTGPENGYTHWGQQVCIGARGGTPTADTKYSTE